MKKLAVLAILAVMLFFTGCRHGGHFVGGLVAGAVAGAILAPAISHPGAYAPVCYDRMVRRGYYTYSHYDYQRIWIPPTMVRECY